MKKLTYKAGETTITVQATNLRDGLNAAKAEAFARKLNVMPNAFKLVAISNAI